MSEIGFIGARIEKDILKLVDETAKEEHLDRTRALKKLIIIGRKQYLIKKYLQLYSEGKCSIDKAAELVGITVSEIMDEAAKAGIHSSETIEEYRKGMELLK